MTREEFMNLKVGHIVEFRIKMGSLVCQILDIEPGRINVTIVFNSGMEYYHIGHIIWFGCEPPHSVERLELIS